MSLYDRFNLLPHSVGSVKIYIKKQYTEVHSVFYFIFIVEKLVYGQTRGDPE